MSNPAPPPFHATGAITGSIKVEISYQIIGLFSEGLYSSPNKAIEELVSNAFDADADHVHVVLSSDLAGADASIAVIDNGSGMDERGLKVHWIVGDSQKANQRRTDAGRHTIGKFGIGKLAAYVLGTRLTHITKSGQKYFSTSMDFTRVPQTADVDNLDEADHPAQPVRLDLRELAEIEARTALSRWLNGTDGRKDLNLFGPEAEDSWTVAVITDLKPMAADLSPGMLRWVLSTAMPIRDDFRLYLNNALVPPSKIGSRRIGRWILGKDLKDIPTPFPGEVEADTDDQFTERDYHHWRLIDQLLGPVTGYVETFQAPIDSGKSTAVGRSNGFFVYVNGRLINSDDAGFGIDRNKLRHGTFSRFRAVINIDRLDDELRSSRETLRDGPRVDRAKELLQGLFNFARAKIEAHENSTNPGRRASERLADSPASLSERPILRLLLSAFDGTTEPRHLIITDKHSYKDANHFRTRIEERIKSGAGIVGNVVYSDLGTHLPMAILDGTTGQLSINLEHPFVAHFADEYGDKKRNLPLELFAVAEILLEAELYDAGISHETIIDVLDERDDLLRHLARSSGAENSLTVAQGLVNSAQSEKGLEVAVVLAFRQLGFEAVPKAGKDEPDGLAEAFLPGGKSGPHHYRVSLEAKSKRDPGARVKKQAVEVATIARHRREANCDHAIVIGPDFETGPSDLGAVVREIDDDRTANPGKTITLMRISDLAKLVRIAPVKRLNLEQLRDLFVTARTPEEAAAWVVRVETASTSPAPYQMILEAVWSIQHDDREHTVEYGSLRTALRLLKSLVINDFELRTECSALSRMAPNLFFAHEDRVELNIHPGKVMDIVHDYVRSLPEELT